MMRNRKLKDCLHAAFSAFFCACFSAPAASHHSFSSVFDPNAPIEIEGTVAVVEWTNPHVWIQLDVGDDDSRVRWAVELGSTNGLIRSGWSRTTVQSGDRIRVTGYRARDGSTRGSVRAITLADGRELAGTTAQPP